MAYVREKSLEGNMVLNITYHDWKERTGGCLCYWFLRGKSNRNHVITPIFLPCPSVAFPKYLVYLLNWCFLCYRRLPGLVIHHNIKKRDFLPCAANIISDEENRPLKHLVPFPQLTPFCLLHFVQLECGSRADPSQPGLQGSISAQALRHTQADWHFSSAPIWNKAKIWTPCYLPVSWATPTAGVHSKKSF